MLLQFSTTAQIITTVAGNGTFAISGDGGPATDAGIQIPGTLCADTLGNFFMISGSRVRKVDIASFITNFAGGGSGGDGSPATSALLAPVGIAIDAANNFYVSSSNKIRKINASGIISTFAGTGVGAYTGDGGPAIAADLEFPGHLTFDDTGNLYITHTHHIRKVNTAGIITTICGNNTAGYSGDGGPATAAQINGPGGIVADKFGNIYFTEISNNCVRKVNAAGIITTIAGNGTSGFSGDGGPASSALLSSPVGLAMDRWGNLYFSDNVRVRMITPAGIITTVAGTGVPLYSGDGGLATAAGIGPQFVAIDPQGNIYISDHQNYRIRKISSFNRAPWFTHGAITTLTACGEFNPTDTLLQVMDSNATQAITWSVVTAPAHGTAAAAYTTMSTGAVLTPVGTGYTPVTGYAGPDTFRVRVTDGVLADTITVAVDVQMFPIAAPVTGADTVCVGHTATLTAPPGGTWSSPDATVGVGAGTGVVTGMSVGTATISYIVANYCGTATAVHTVTVLPAGTCPAGIGNIARNNDISIFPNPNTGSFTVQVPASNSRITITDVTGRKILQCEGSASCYCILPSGCSGVYIVEVSNEATRSYTKIMVQ